MKRLFRLHTPKVQNPEATDPQSESQPSYKLLKMVALNVRDVWIY